MRNYLRSVFTYARQGAAAFLVGLGIGSFLIGPAALALVLPPNFAPRQFPEQMTHYIRFPVNFNSCILPATAGNCSFKVGALPYNAFVVRGYLVVYTAFNSTTTDTVALGVSSGGTTLVAATSTHATNAGGAALTIANMTGVTGANATQTGGDGGFDIWATIAYTGATAASAGAAAIVLEYAAPNDGGCAPVPMTSTAPGC